MMLIVLFLLFWILHSYRAIFAIFLFFTSPCMMRYFCYFHFVIHDAAIVLFLLFCYLGYSIHAVAIVLFLLFWILHT